MNDLVTRAAAAKALYVTEGMISYWIRKGRAKKYYLEGSTRYYLVSMAEMRYAADWQQNELDRFASEELDAQNRYVTRSEAAKLLYVEEPQISYYCKRGYLSKHYVLGSGRTYMLLLDEVLQLPLRRKQVEERRVHDLRVNYKKNPPPRDARGQRFVRREND